MRSSLDYAGFAQLCERSATMRAYYRIIPRCLDNKLHSLLVILLVCLVLHNKSWRRCDMETVPVSLSVELTVSQLFCEWHNYALVQRITVATTAVDRKCIDFVFFDDVRGCFLTSSLAATLSLTLTIPMSAIADIFVSQVCHNVTGTKPMK